ncbi:MAG: hypothetical protein QOE70_1969 [Chthoniobacter sp.]|jgi:hypothetical protein|nr:hypothetical protein [Chthoniobacter sp.]
MKSHRFSLIPQLSAALLAAAIATPSLHAQAPATPVPAGGTGASTTGTTAAAKPKPLAPTDKKFVKDINDAILIEQKLLALVARPEKPLSESLKRTTTKMTGDLKKIWELFATLGMAKGAELSTEVTKPQAADVAKTAKLKDDKFEKEFVKDLAKETGKAKKAFESAGKSLQDPDLKKFVTDWTATIQTHDDDMVRLEKESAKKPK